MPVSQDPTANHLLAALAPAERERIFPHLQFVDMPLGKVLYESGDTLRHVYFPTDCIVSTALCAALTVRSAELAVAGNEGLIGIALFMGGETTPNRAVVQSTGHAYRLSGQRIKDEFHRDGTLQELFLRYTQALITQMAQTAVCNRHHSVDQQLCRWLLLSLDRLSANKLKMTQELIADMLGVRREGVTEAAGKLQRLGVIRYSRGQITVLDRPRLEQLSCECYAVVKREDGSAAAVRDPDPTSRQRLARSGRQPLRIDELRRTRSGSAGRDWIGTDGRMGGLRRPIARDKAQFAPIHAPCRQHPRQGRMQCTAGLRFQEAVEGTTEHRIPVESEQACARAVEFAQRRGAIDGEAGGRRKVVELDLPIQRCFQLGHRAAQLFLLQVQLHLMHLQLVQQLERVCGRRRRRREFVQDRKRSSRVRPCVLRIAVPGQARKSPQAQTLLTGRFVFFARHGFTSILH